MGAAGSADGYREMGYGSLCSAFVMAARLVSRDGRGACRGFPVVELQLGPVR
jgi:hypothetical protein